MLTYTFKKGSAEAVDIKTTYGVRVEKSTGLIGKPSLKSVDNFDWKYLHGTTPDLRNRRYNNREITLTCWMNAQSKQRLVERFNNFINYFSHDELILMKVSWDGRDGHEPMYPTDPNVSKGLYYLVWLSKVDDVSFKWRFGKQHIRFKLTLVDPYPVKSVYRYRQGDNPQRDVAGIHYDVISDTEIDIFTDEGVEVYDILTKQGHIDCGYGTTILLCGDVTRATSGNFTYEAADPEVEVDLDDPSTYVITGYRLVYPESNEDVVYTIYSEI